jgi:ubiquinone biosynthesis monooxygenase Coq7
MRQYSLSDQICLKADDLLRFLSGHQLSADKLRENPAKNISEPDLNPDEKKLVSGLMRVNYTGEVCAQALYQGQALTSRNLDTKRQLEQAGLEEIDHLFWCQSRLQDLDSRVSFLNPLWYTASFLLGAAAGLCGDRLSLGFLEETEKQVTKHLENHLDIIPLQDSKTRVILEKMREEEASHAEVAYHAGAAVLPEFIKTAMRFTSKLMTKISYWV